MKQVIDTLRHELFDDVWCHNDFEKYDVPTLRQSNEPFLWLVYPSGTHLTMCGAMAISQLFDNEAKRIQMFQDPKAPISALLYQGRSNDRYKCFYYSGYKLERISVNEAADIWGNLIGQSLVKAQREHVEEYHNSEDPLPIKFASEQTENAYLKETQLAKEMGDCSLLDCVKRLQNWTRCAVNHYILLSMDFTDHSFCFTEMVNETPRINGGIIADFGKQNNRWSIHT